MACLEGRNFTTKLYPQITFLLIARSEFQVNPGRLLLLGGAGLDHNPGTLQGLSKVHRGTVIPFLDLRGRSELRVEQSTQYQ